jgi:hypothetical protein
MPERKSPRLRTVEKVAPPYLLNEFPKDFGKKLGQAIIHLLATKPEATLEGSEWEAIFAECVGATWKPSNNGLDDVVLDQCAWGAKTVKGKPSTVVRVRLISGRNSPGYSFGEADVMRDPDKIGSDVLEIWNERVSSIRKKHKHLRTVVLIKGDGLTELAVFEFEAIRYDPELYKWIRNKDGNLEGRLKKTDVHYFTWQPHGSQFTIIEDVPDKCLVINLKAPPKLNREEVFKIIVYEDSWITVTERHVR